MKELLDSANEDAAAFFSFLAKKTTSEWILTIVFAALVIVITAICAHVVRKLILRLLSQSNGHVAQATIFVNIARAIIWFIGICIILTTGFDVNISALLGALGIGGIAISLGMQNTISNFIGGLQLSTMRFVNVGDYVEYEGIVGTVTDITWRHTIIQGLRGERTVVPNSAVNSTALTILPPLRCVKVPFSIPFETAGNLSAQQKTLALACEEIEWAVADALQAPKPAGLGLQLDKQPTAKLRQTGEYAFLGAITVWVSEGQDFSRPEVEDCILRAAATTISEGFAGKE